MAKNSWIFSHPITIDLPPLLRARGYIRPTGPYESDLTVDCTRSIGVTIHNPIPPCLTVETGSRSQVASRGQTFQAPAAYSQYSGRSNCLRGRGRDQTAEPLTPSRFWVAFSNDNSPKIPPRLPVLFFLKKVDFVIDPANKHHLKEVLHKQAQDTGVSALHRQCAGRMKPPLNTYLLCSWRQGWGSC